MAQQMIDVKFTATTSEKLNAIPVINGQVLALADRAAAYYDLGKTRYQIGGFSYVSQPPTLENVDDPVDGYLYICTNPGSLYFYLNENFFKIAGGIDLTVDSKSKGNVVTSIDSDKNSAKLVVHKDFSAAAAEDLKKHVETKSGNPHAVSADDIGLARVDNTPDREKEVKSATKLATTRKIDGVDFDGTDNVIHFAICNSSVDSVQKEVELPNCSNLWTGLRISIFFTNGNSAQNISIKINQLSAIKVNYLGATIAKDSKTIKAKSLVSFIYDGSVFLLDGGVDTLYELATQTASGLLSAQDKKKLDGIQEGATKVDPATQTPKKPEGSGTVGTSNKYAREDHVHPLQEIPTFDGTKAGLVPVPSGESSGRVLLDDGTWGNASSAIEGASLNITSGPGIDFYEISKSNYLISSKYTIGDCKCSELCEFILDIGKESVTIFIDGTLNVTSSDYILDIAGSQVILDFSNGSINAERSIDINCIDKTNVIIRNLYIEVETNTGTFIELNSYTLGKSLILENCCINCYDPVHTRPLVYMLNCNSNIKITNCDITCYSDIIYYEFNLNQIDSTSLIILSENTLYLDSVTSYIVNMSTTSTSTNKFRYKPVVNDNIVLNSNNRYNLIKIRSDLYDVSFNNYVMEK